ncbi:MAG TPA: type II secretion system F family protein [Polyangiaceae bacterium]|nr:type II secretion system F family protein [Polyangiaceae bacterium]
MSPATWWLGRFTVALIGVSMAGLAAALFGGRSAPGQVALRAYTSGLEKKARFIRWKARGLHVLVTQGAGGLLCVIAALVFGKWLALLLLPAIVLGPKLVIEQQAAKRITRVEEQIEPWLNGVANALKASPSLGEAIASTVSLVQSPMSEEIDVLVKECELGTPLDRALDNLAERIDTPTLSGTVLALKVARKSGGNLPEMLENAAAALRELARLEGVVRTKTAEGKAQAFVIAIIPVPMVFGIRAMAPHFFEPLSQTSLGNLIIAGSVVLWVAAILSARKILAVDV